MAVLKYRCKDHGSRNGRHGFSQKGEPLKPSADFTLQNEGSIFLLQPMTQAARFWVDEFLPEGRMEFAGAVVVEHRYIADIVEGIRGYGLEVA